LTFCTMGRWGGQKKKEKRSPKTTEPLSTWHGKERGKKRGQKPFQGGRCRGGRGRELVTRVTQGKKEITLPGQGGGGNLKKHNASQNVNQKTMEKKEKNWQWGDLQLGKEVGSSIKKAKWGGGQKVSKKEKKASPNIGSNKRQQR